jgi:hypothetical protein
VKSEWIAATVERAAHGTLPRVPLEGQDGGV